MFARSVLALSTVLCLAAPLSAQTHDAHSTKATKGKSITPAAVTVQPTAISGLSSSGRNCLTPAAIGTHYLGWVDERSRVTISFSADFDPVASATFMRFGERAADGDLVEGFDIADDDGGGGLNPRIDADAPYGGYLMLFVSPFANAGPGGCYFYKVEIRTP